MDKELLKGNTEMLILASLEESPKHGYLITKYLRDLSGEGFQFSAGMLYPLLHALEKKELIKGTWEKEAVGRKRKFYALTGKGKTHLAQKKKNWNAFTSFIATVIHA